MGSLTRLLFVILFLFLFVTGSHSQSELKFERLSVDDGLTSVNCILHDRYGFTWIGGSNGLFRFDGHKFSPFYHSPKDHSSISSNNVISLYEDHRGLIWIGTFNGGLNYFDPATEKFYHFFHSDKIRNTISNNVVTDIVEGQHDEMWIATMGGLDRLNFKKGEFKHFRSSPAVGSISSNEIFSLSKSDDGSLWIASNCGTLDRFDDQTETFTHFRYHDGFYRSGRTGQRLLQDHNNIWIGTEGDGLYRFDKHERKFYHFSAGMRAGKMSNNIVTDLALAKDGSIWLSTDGGGLNHFEPHSESFTNYQFDPTNEFSISNNSSYCLYLDPVDESIILGMGDGTINIHRPSPFKIYSPSNQFSNSLGFRVVVSLYLEKNDVLWIGTGGGGISRFNLADRSFRNYQSSSESNALSSNIILSMDGDQDGNIWIGTFLGGLNRFNPGHENFTVYRNKPSETNSLVNDHVFDVACADQKIWIATHGAGLDKFDVTRGRFEHFGNVATGDVPQGSSRLLSLRADKSDRLWVGTLDAGLIKFENGKFSSVKYAAESIDDLKKYPINQIAQDSNGEIWIATTGNGITHFDPKSGSYTHYTIEDGLPSNSVYGSIKDDDGAIWMSTNKGMARLDRKTGHIATFTTSDGLPTNDLESGAIQKSSAGILFFGSKKGLIEVDPKLLKPTAQNPKVLLTNFRIGNETVRPGQEMEDVIPLRRSITVVNSIELPYALNNVAIDFAAPDLPTAHERISKYQYRLTNLSESWVETESPNRTAHFSNLKPGKYQFEVCAVQSSGLVSNKITSLQLIITPPFYKSTLAYEIYSLIAGALLFLFVREVRNRVSLINQLEIQKVKHRMDQEIYLSRIDFFTSISHELRTPLSLIVGPLEKVISSVSRNREVVAPLLVIQRNALKLLTLVNQLLDFRKVDSGTMRLNVRKGDISELLKEIKTSFEALAAEKNIDLRLELKSSHLSGYFDEGKLESILTNLLSNAIKFSPDGGVVCLSAEMQDVNCVFQVSDNGDGIADDELPKIFDPFYQATNFSTNRATGTGIGLSLVKNLVEVLRGKVTVKSTLGRGSVFSVLIPVKKEMFKIDEFVPEPAKTGPTLMPAQDGHTQNIDLKERRENSILIVEDHTDLRQFIVKELDELFYVEEASNGKNGIDKAVEMIPDLIISDIMMPDIDGVELCKVLKTDERTSHIPVILLTARGLPEQQFEGLETGADDYIIKPFNIDLLTARILNLIENRQKLRERFSREVYLKPKDIAITSADEIFLEKVLAAVEERMADPEFSVSELARDVGMSHSVLYRKILALTDKNISEFVKTVRLQRAEQLLAASTFSINEISDQTGFSNPKYFATCFKAHFGVPPKNFQKQLLKKEKN